jgi:hypothetical protein
VVATAYWTKTTGLNFCCGRENGQSDIRMVPRLTLSIARLEKAPPGGRSRIILPCTEQKLCCTQLAWWRFESRFNALPARMNPH